MKPYYERGGITMYHGNSRDVLPELPRVQTVLTDPPFFTPATYYQSRVDWQRTTGDMSVLGLFWDVICDAAVKRLEPDGQLLTFCNGDSFAVFHAPIFARFSLVSTLVWNKTAVGLGRVWRHQHELMILGRWPESWDPNDGKLRSDVLSVAATPSAARLHPVEKPVALLRQLIEGTTPEGGIVLDPFMGSGTTLRAAKDSGRRAIGIEIEEAYCEIAAKRLAQEVLEL